jgi:complement component 1 Q subcomponent-binding protein
LIDQDDTNVVQLLKKKHNSQILILFAGTPPLPTKDEYIHLHPPNNISDPIETILIEDKVKQNEQDQPTFSVDFSVCITSPKGETIAFECNTADSKVALKLALI